MDISFCFPGTDGENTAAGLHASCKFSFYKKLPNCLLGCMYQFILPPAMCVWPSVSACIFTSIWCHHYLNFFILAILICAYISLQFWLHFLDKDAEHLFVCLLTICVPSLVKSLFMPFAQILTGSFLLFWFAVDVWVILSIFYMLVICEMSGLEIFSLSLQLIFSFSYQDLLQKMVLNLDKVQFITFSAYGLLLVSHIRILCWVLLPSSWF